MKSNKFFKPKSRADATSARTRSGKDVLELRAPLKSYGPDYSSGAFVYFQLSSGKDSYGSLKSGSASQLRNIGVYDLNQDTTHWVFPDAHQKIESFEPIEKRVETNGEGKTFVRTGFILTVARSLSDGSASRGLWVMRPNGSALKNLLSDISAAPDIRTYGDNQMKLIMQTKTHIDVYPFDVDVLTVGEPTRVSIP